MKLLSKVSPNTSASYRYGERYIFHYHNTRCISFLCMTDAGFAKSISYEFLFEVRERFFKKFGEDFKSLNAYAAEREFADEMKERMSYYNSDAALIKKVKANIDLAKDIMIQNIDKVLARGDQIELLVSKTQQMSEGAISLRTSAEKVRRHAWWKYAKLSIFIVLGVTSLVVFFVVVALSIGGFDFK
jgi:vesicle-associated membrane protein 7